MNDKLPLYWIEVVGKRWRIRCSNGKIVQPAENMTRATDASEGARNFADWTRDNALTVYHGSQMRVVRNSGPKKKAKVKR